MAHIRGARETALSLSLSPGVLTVSLAGVLPFSDDGAVGRLTTCISSSARMEMGEHYHYLRTELEDVIKNQQQHHHFLCPPTPPPPILPEMVGQNPFRFAGFFQSGLLGRQQHHPGMMVAMGDQDEVATHLELESGLLYPPRIEFCSTDDLPTSIASNATHLHGVAVDGDLILGVHGAIDSNCGTGTDNVRRCTSSSPSGKMEEIQGGDGGGSRWPRHETLTLLELRAQLDSKFREVTHKGPLWEELAREMAEGYGYHRSGKKCREKFENLYKYYKKTKEGRTGRQDGKNYRFYAQLEALCGGDGGKSSKYNGTSKLNLMANSEFDLEVLKGGGLTDRKKPLDHREKMFDSPEFDILSTSSGQSEEGRLEKEDRKKEKAKEERESWKRNMKSCMEKQMKRFMYRQEEWFERILKTLEHQEEERLVREEVWRKEERDRLQKEHEFWAKEREWAEARDVKLIELLRKMIGEGCTTNALSTPPAHFDMHECEPNHKEWTCGNNNSEAPLAETTARDAPQT